MLPVAAQVVNQTDKDVSLKSWNGPICVEIRKSFPSLFLNKTVGNN